MLNNKYFFTVTDVAIETDIIDVSFESYQEWWDYVSDTIYTLKKIPQAACGKYVISYETPNNFGDWLEISEFDKMFNEDFFEPYNYDNSDLREQMFLDHYYYGLD